MDQDALHRRLNASGFTLIELLVVVIILAILAALVVPQFGNAAGAAREVSLRDDLRYLRTQIMVYGAQHHGMSPGYPEGDPAAAPTFEAFVAQLTMYTDAHGATSTTPSGRFKYGPYLQRIPTNPINGSDRIRFVAADAVFPAAPAGEEGWVYQPSTGTIAANVAGADHTGLAYFDY